MALSLFNTLTRRVEPLAPLAAPRVTLYTRANGLELRPHRQLSHVLFEDLRRHLKVGLRRFRS
jgi:hypothetical protein